MKKGIYAVLAILTVFALVLGVTSCGGDSSSSGTKKYTVNLNLDGGKYKGKDASPIVLKVEDGETIDPTYFSPTDLTKDGFTFDGWKDTANVEFKITDTVKKDLTLKAQWKAGSAGTGFTVTFDSAGGSTVAPITGVASGAKITKPTDPTRSASTGAAYTFEGWFKEAALTNAWDFATDTVTANITLYAKWTAPAGLVTYDVTFDSNGGSAVATIKDVESGTKITAPTAPTKPGFDFGGWYKEAALTNEWKFDTDTVTTAITLYAKWVVVYTVTFDLNGGKGKADPMTSTGTAITLPKGLAGPDATPVFAGWKVGSATGADATSPYTPTADVTLFATYKAIDIVEEISLGKAWNAIYVFTLPAGKTWADYDQTLTATYKLSNATFLGSAPRAVRAMGNFLPVEIANPRLGIYSPAGGDPVNVASVGNWPGGTSNEWIFSQIGSSWDAGKFPDVLGDWTVPDGFDIEADKWFTVFYPVNGVGIDKVADDGTTSKVGGPNGTWNRAGVAGRSPAATDTGPFYFGVGLPGESVNTWQIGNVTLVGKGDTADVVGLPLYYSQGGKTFRALNGNIQSPNADGYCTGMNDGNPNWKIISGGDKVATITIASTEKPFVETVKVKFDAQGGSTVADQTINRGEMLTNAQLGPATSWAGHRLDGWFTEATGGTQVNTGTFYKVFTDDETTYYAHWTELPDATTDVDIVMEGFKVTSFGGLGAKNENAGLGPFVYKSSKDPSTGQQYDACIWFANPTETTTANYDKIQITVTLAIAEGESKPMKLAVHTGRPADQWSGGVSDYKETSADGDFTFDIPVGTVGVTLQHNRNNDESSGFSLTLKSIKLIAPTE
jgi:uncharacterized repeat protein (TIGR02543 family)